MQRPDLEHNNYYPYYTQTSNRKIGSLYKVVTIMHLSEKSGIVISRYYRNRKTTEIYLEMINNMHNMPELRRESKQICYTDFATEVETVYDLLSSAAKTLLTAKAYKTGYWETTYLKYNRSIHFECDRESINILFGKTKGIDKAEEYQEIDSGQFYKKLNESWNALIEYFKCPKYIRKTAYEPNYKQISKG